jgi:prepilin-type N-terminal cleavage/methylation domain-containing protein
MNPRPRQKPRLARRAFSLVEMLVVIFIAGILVAITVGAVSALNKMGGKQQTQAMIAAFDAALDENKASTGEYPSIAGTFLANASNLTAASYTEATYMNQALNALSPNRLDNTKAALDANNSLISMLKPNTDTYTTTITSALAEFRTASNVGVATTTTTATAAALAVEAARVNQGNTISFVRDAWDRYIVYFPSDTASTATASTLRPMFASPGPDGILQSTPWSSTAIYTTSSYVYYKQRWYKSTAAGANATPPSEAPTRWVEYASDDIITRGDWR